MDPRTSTRRLVRAASLLIALALLAATTGTVAATTPSTATDSFTFWPVADTTVDSSLPTSAFGTSSSLSVDKSPLKVALLRFDVRGLSGRTVRNVRLSMYNTNAAPVGGRVFALSSDTWAETVTWNTKPAIDGPQLAAFGAVATTRWYELDLGNVVTADDVVSFAIDSTNSDGAAWGSREGSRPPRLIVDTEPVAGLTVEGASRVAHANAGSSEPTYHPSNHRLAVTAGGRLLAVHGFHATGVQLAWRNPGGGWQTDSKGSTTDGILLRGTATGDWAASIAVARDASGVEHAWVVWSGGKFGTTTYRPVQLVRLSDLDAPGGPTVGTPVTIDTPARGASKPDIAFEVRPDGSRRGVVTWFRWVGDTAYEMVAGWFSDLATPTPAISDVSVLFTSTSTSRIATVEPAADGGIRLVARLSSRIAIWRHDPASAGTAWVAGVSGVSTSSGSMPAAVVLSSGETLAALESNTTSRVVTVQRFSANGTTATVDLQVTGYTKPTITSDGTSATVVMIRVSDGALVSRTLTPGAGWSADRVEIAGDAFGPLSYPNALRRSRDLEVILEGPNGKTTSQSEVLALTRRR